MYNDSKKTNDIYDCIIKYDVLNSNIKKFRQQANLTQLELAEKSHINSKYLSRLENNYYKSHLHVYIQIAEALNISVYDLIGDITNEKQSFIDQVKLLTNDMNEKQRKLILESIALIRKYMNLDYNYN